MHPSGKGLGNRGNRRACGAGHGALHQVEEGCAFAVCWAQHCCPSSAWMGASPVGSHNSLTYVAALTSPPCAVAAVQMFTVPETMFYIPWEEKKDLGEWRLSRRGP